MKTGNFYQPEFLMGDLLSAARSQDRHVFVRFQGEKSQELSGVPMFDFLAVNILRLNGRGVLDGEIVSAVYNVSPKVIGNYQDNLHLDDFTPQLFSRPGAALFNDALRPMDDWIDRPIYTRHCNLFDYHRVCEVAYDYPFHSRPRIVIFISVDNNRDFPEGLNEETVEYVFFPFYLGWLHVYRLIDDRTLKVWLSHLAGMSLPRFRVIRSLFEPCTLSAAKLSSRLGVSAAAVNRHLENTLEGLMRIHPRLQSREGNANRLAEILKAYRFFEFAPGMTKRDMPRRKEAEEKGLQSGISM